MLWKLRCPRPCRKSDPWPYIGEWSCLEEAYSRFLRNAIAYPPTYKASRYQIVVLFYTVVRISILTLKRVVRIVSTRWLVIFHCGSQGLMPGHSARDLWSVYCLLRKSISSRQCCVFNRLSTAVGAVVPLVVYMGKGNGSS